MYYNGLVFIRPPRAPCDPGCDPGFDPGCDPGFDLGCDQGCDPGCDPGFDPGFDWGRSWVQLCAAWHCWAPLGTFVLILQHVAGNH